MRPIRTNIYKRKFRSGRESWMVRWRSLETGSWRAVTGGRTKDEALIFEARVRELLFRGVEPADAIKSAQNGSEITVSMLIEQYLSSPRFQNLTANWKVCLSGMATGPITHRIGNLRIANLSNEKIIDFYQWLKLSKRLSNSTIKKYHLLLCQIGDFYTDANPDAKNPFRGLKGFRKIFPKQPPTRDIGFLTRYEINLILEEAKKSSSELLYYFLKLLAFTGMRRNEAINLKWKAVDFSSGFITILRTKTNIPRTIPIEPEVLEVLRELRTSSRSEFVFSKSDGGRCDPSRFLKPLKKVVSKIGIEKRVDLHTFRHSYGSNKIREGFGLKKVSKLLGHTEVTMTANIYTHLLDGDLKVRDEYLLKEESTSFNMDGEKLVELKQAFGDFIKKLNKTDELRALLKDSTMTSLLKALCYASAIGEDSKTSMKSKTSNSENDLFKNSGDLEGVIMAHPRGLEPLTLRSEV